MAVCKRNGPVLSGRLSGSVEEAMRKTRQMLKSLLVRRGIYLTWTEKSLENSRFQKPTFPIIYRCCFKAHRNLFFLILFQKLDLNRVEIVALFLYSINSEPLSVCTLFFKRPNVTLPREKLFIAEKK